MIIIVLLFGNPGNPYGNPFGNLAGNLSGPGCVHTSSCGIPFGEKRKPIPYSISNINCFKP